MKSLETILRKKYVIIATALICLLLFLITGITYMFINTKSILLKNDLTCNFKEDIYLKEFIDKLDGKLKNNYKIDTSKVGTQKLKAIYIDKHGLYKVKSFNIEVKDTTPPTILINNTYTVTKGYEGSLEDDILCADNYDDGITCQITGSYNLDETGTYPLTISAIDKSENSISKDFELNVVEPKKDIAKENMTSSYTPYQEVYKKYKNEQTLIGIDISKWQKEIDFKALKNNNVEFIMIKLGGQTKINGELLLDPNFEKNINRAIQEGFQVGVYFYSYAKNTKDAIKQAKFIMKNIQNYEVNLPIAFDWENWTEYNKFKISFNSLNNIAQAFIEELEKNDYDTLLYTSEYYLNEIWFPNDYNNIWIAKYGDLNYQENYKIWQTCSDGKIDGIEELVDIDVMYLK